MGFTTRTRSTPTPTSTIFPVAPGLLRAFMSGGVIVCAIATSLAPGFHAGHTLIDAGDVGMALIAAGKEAA